MEGLVVKIWLNTLVLIIAGMVGGVILYGIVYEMRKIAEALARIEETAGYIAAALKRPDPQA